MNRNHRYVFGFLFFSAVLISFQNCSNPSFEAADISQKSLENYSSSIITHSSKDNDTLANASIASSSAKLNCPALAYNMAVCHKVKTETGDTCRVFSNTGVNLYTAQGSATTTDITIPCTQLTEENDSSQSGETQVSHTDSSSQDEKVLICPSLELMKEKCSVVSREIGDTCRISSTDGILLYTLKGHTTQITDIWTPCHTK